MLHGLSLIGLWVWQCLLFLRTVRLRFMSKILMVEIFSSNLVPLSGTLAGRHIIPLYEINYFLLRCRWEPTRLECTQVSCCSHWQNVLHDLWLWSTFRTLSAHLGQVSAIIKLFRNWKIVIHILGFWNKPHTYLFVQNYYINQCWLFPSLWK